MTRFALLGAVLLAGCGRTDPPTPEPFDGYPLTVTDSRGRAVAFPKRPERIVSLSPGITETLFAVGAGPRVVAVTTVDSHPPEVKQLPTVGGFGAKTVNVEAVLAQRPDAVLATGRLLQPVLDALETHGVLVFTQDPNTFDEVATSIEAVGKVVGCEAKADEVAADFRRRLAAVRDRTAKVTDADRPTVLYLVSDEPLMAAGPGTYVGQMIELAGGRNVFADVTQQYPRVSDEAVIQRGPAIVLAPDMGVSGLAGRIAARPGWEKLAAIREGRIHALHEDQVSRPGPRLVDALEAVEAVLRKGR